MCVSCDRKSHNSVKTLSLDIRVSCSCIKGTLSEMNLNVYQWNLLWAFSFLNLISESRSCDHTKWTYILLGLEKNEWNTPGRHLYSPTQQETIWKRCNLWARWFMDHWISVITLEVVTARDPDARVQITCSGSSAEVTDDWKQSKRSQT